jgi:hypothetical protein
VARKVYWLYLAVVLATLNDRRGSDRYKKALRCFEMGFQYNKLSVKLGKKRAEFYASPGDPVVWSFSSGTRRRTDYRF